MITIEFRDFDDMMGFARALAGTVPAEPVHTEAASAGTPAPVQQPAVPTQQPVPPALVIPTSAPVQQPAVPAPVAVPPAPVQTAPIVPTSSVNYTLDDLARAAMTLMDSGRQGDLLGLLGQFGVEALPALPKEQYGMFATALRGMGVQI